MGYKDAAAYVAALHLASKKRFMTSIRFVRGENQAYVKAAIVLVKHIRVLVIQDILVLTPGMKPVYKFSGTLPGYSQASR